MYEVQSGSTKYEVQSTKYGIRVIGCFLLLLYQVRSTKYQVGHSSNWIIVVFFIQKSKFDIRYFQFRISYLVFPTLYLVLGTLYYFPNSILTELMQYRMPPLSVGPSGKRWPRCPPQEAQRISSRIMKWL